MVALVLAPLPASRKVEQAPPPHRSARACRPTAADTQNNITQTVRPESSPTRCWPYPNLTSGVFLTMGAKFVTGEFVWLWSRDTTIGNLQ